MNGMSSFAYGAQETVEEIYCTTALLCVSDVTLVGPHGQQLTTTD